MEVDEVEGWGEGGGKGWIYGERPWGGGGGGDDQLTCGVLTTHSSLRPFLLDHS